jgi:heat shock protein HslJ
MNIRDVQWRITEVRGSPVQPADQPIALTLATADDRVTGYTGVNRFGGGYELEGESLSFGALVMTRRAGPQPLMDQETAITQALEAVRAWRPAPGGGVELLDEQGTVMMKLSRGE